VVAKLDELIAKEFRGGTSSLIATANQCTGLVGEHGENVASTLHLKRQFAQFVWRSCIGKPLIICVRQNGQSLKRDRL
jgi:hypothetical protein